MTAKQNILRIIYPVFIRLNRLFNKKNEVIINPGNISPVVPFYSLQSTLSDGTRFNFSSLKGKKVLLVNLASDCGYTPQYTELEKLYRQHKEKLVVLGFPANDFKGQEPGTDQEIDSFCRREYGVTFPLFQKNSVTPPDQQLVFQWLTSKKMNGWNEQLPSWNFSKYLVDETGKLQAFFAPTVSPQGEEIGSLIR
jgi:glutathione peroxidase